MKPQLGDSPVLPSSGIRSRTRVLSTILHHLLMPVDVASLVYFRIVFGALMLAEVINWAIRGQIYSYYIQPSFHFKYYGFEWIPLLPAMGMYLLLQVLGVLAFFIMVGFLYRISAILFFLGFTYIFLLDQAFYHNHLYLIVLLSFLMIFVPAHRALSVDAALQSRLHTDAVRAWALWVLRAQIGIVYFYAGLAKLMSNDWLHGVQMHIWLSEKSETTTATTYPFVGPLVGYLLTKEWVAYVTSYAGMLFDLSVVPLLLWRRTRLFALVMAVGFHLTNAILLNLTLFPLLMIAATLLFLSPAWPRRILSRLRLAEGRGRLGRSNLEPANTPLLQPKRAAKVAMIGLFILFFALQLLVPLRHFLYPGDVFWTQEGYRFSWQMYLRDNNAAWTRFFVVDLASGEAWFVDPRDYLTRKQNHYLAEHPDMILQFSHYIAHSYQERGHEQVEVYAEAWMPLNGREPRRIIDPTVNLAAQPRTLMPAEWIMPLEVQPTQRSTEIANKVNEVLEVGQDQGKEIASLAKDGGCVLAKERSFQESNYLLSVSPPSDADISAWVNEEYNRILDQTQDNGLKDSLNKSAEVSRNVVEERMKAARVPLWDEKMDVKESAQVADQVCNL